MGWGPRFRGAARRGEGRLKETRNKKSNTVRRPTSVNPGTLRKFWHFKKKYDLMAATIIINFMKIFFFKNERTIYLIGSILYLLEGIWK